MTIKKQFSLLIAIVVIIPILSLVFLFVEKNLHSSKKNLKYIEQESFSKNEEELNKNIKRILMTLPPNIEFILFNEDSESLYACNFKRTDKSTFTTKEQIYNYIENTSSNYTYQITKNMENDNTLVIITRYSNNKRKNPSIEIPILVFISICLVLCLIFILYIIINIFDSIMYVKNQTANLISGEFSDEKNPAPHSSNEITEIVKSLDTMKTSLKDTQNRQNKFIMGLSHDLRTPIAVIKGYIEAISDGIITNPNDINETMELIASKTEKLETMINSLINFMKMDSKEYRNTLIPSPIKTIITDFAKEAENSGRVFNRKITYSIDLTKDYFIPLDQQLVTRAFENLYSNALRYTKDGDFISISAEDDKQNIYIKFCDTGEGIEKKDLANIFDMFYRGTNSRREEGMGIGLSVVKNIIDIHSWKINVDSEKNIGTYFTITIPLSQAAE